MIDFDDDGVLNFEDVLAVLKIVAAFEESGLKPSNKYTQSELEPQENASQSVEEKKDSNQAEGLPFDCINEGKAHEHEVDKDEVDHEAQDPSGKATLTPLETLRIAAQMALDEASSCDEEALNKFITYDDFCRIMSHTDLPSKFTVSLL